MYIFHYVSLKAFGLLGYSGLYVVHAFVHNIIHLLTIPVCRNTIKEFPQTHRDNFPV